MTKFNHRLACISVTTCLALAAGQGWAQTTSPTDLQDPNRANRPDTSSTTTTPTTPTDRMPDGTVRNQGGNVTGTTGSPAMGSANPSMNSNTRSDPNRMNNGNNRDTNNTMDSNATGADSANQNNMRAPRRDRN
jgi:hypothetical protein